MAINPFNPLIPNASGKSHTIQITPSEIEAKTDQLKSIIPAEALDPSQIPLEKDRHTPHGFHFFKDIDPAKNEMEEGVFLKTTYHPSMKLEEVENFQNLETKKDVKGNEYVGFFPEGCTLANGIFKSSGIHKFVGVFDHSGKLTSGSWTWSQDNLGFTLEGNFTYQETEAAHTILCDGVYTFAGKYEIAKGVFEVERKIQESYFYCTKQPMEDIAGNIETKTDSKYTKTGIFNGEKLFYGRKESSSIVDIGEFSKAGMLVCGSKTFKKQKITVEGLWNYVKNKRGDTFINIISYCHGRKVGYREKGSFREDSLERGKKECESGTVIEGQFFHIQTNNNIPCEITVYQKGSDPEKKWALHGSYYHSKEDAKDSLYRNGAVIPQYYPS